MSYVVKNGKYSNFFSNNMCMYKLLTHLCEGMSFLQNKRILNKG